MTEQAPRAAIAAISQISAVPMMLRVITEVTGLRLSLVAHVTATEWTCCAVNDQLADGNELLGARPLPEWTTPIVARMKRSTARIMSLVDDVVDFARGRLGGGIPIQA